MSGSYNSRRWRRLRARYLAEHPRCECAECLTLPGRQRPAATDVHHLDGQGLTGPRAYDWDNLQAMAHGHHSAETSRHLGARDRPEQLHPGLRQAAEDLAAARSLTLDEAVAKLSHG